MTLDEARLRLLTELQALESEKAYTEGHAAGLAGRPESDCPIPDDRRSHGVWTCGHWQGRQRYLRALLGPERGD